MLDRNCRARSQPPVCGRLFSCLLLFSTLAAAETEVVMLGTGTPISDPQRSGPAVAVVVDGYPYLFDFGPGVVRKAAAASPEFGGSISGLNVRKLNVAFLTHLHADHSAGLADLILTPWTMGRDRPLRIYGPKGLAEMVAHTTDAFREDVRYRVYGLEPANDQGWRVDAHEIEDGVIFEDQRVKVEAFSVTHGSWPNAFGYRVTSSDRVVVISGDSADIDRVKKHATGADVLIHEAYAKDSLTARGNKFWSKYHAENHTSVADVAALANQVEPGLLVLTHILFFEATEADILATIRESYDGATVIANDLDVY